MWFLQHNNKKIKEFDSGKEADEYMKRLGESVSRYYRLVAETGNARIDKMLMEGMVKGDLNNILLPRISIDEYVPADPETDNIVVAFFIKGVPEAVLPFKNFVEKSNGVHSADYGDSDTIVNTSIVYVEFDRENLDYSDISDLLVQTAMLADIDVEDFTMTFPHTNSKFPYEPEILKRYFISRNERKNRIAQQKALDAARKDFESDVAKMAQGDKDEPEDQEHVRGDIAQGSQEQQMRRDEKQQAQEALIQKIGRYFPYRIIP